MWQWKKEEKDRTESLDQFLCASHHRLDSEHAPFSSTQAISPILHEMLLGERGEAFRSGRPSTNRISIQK